MRLQGVGANFFEPKFVVWPIPGRRRGKEPTALCGVEAYTLHPASIMRNPVRSIFIVIAILGAGWLLLPQLRPLLFSASEPRQVAARGVLSDFEQTTIALFERVSPSVVQVVVQRVGDVDEAERADVQRDGANPRRDARVGR